MKAMITADYVTGKLKWTTALSGREALRESTGGGERVKEKVPKLSHDLSGLRLGDKNATAELDTLVSSMEGQQAIPTPIGEGRSKRKAITTDKPKKPKRGSKKRPFIATTSRLKPYEKSATEEAFDDVTMRQLRSKPYPRTYERKRKA